MGVSEVLDKLLTADLQSTALALMEDLDNHPMGAVDIESRTRRRVLGEEQPQSSSWNSNSNNSSTGENRTNKYNNMKGSGGKNSHMNSKKGGGKGQQGQQGMMNNYNNYKGKDNSKSKSSLGGKANGNNNNLTSSKGKDSPAGQVKEDSGEVVVVKDAW